ncbi:MAG: AI-2E family transporter [candidate division NC10 bacterium]|nr:AI-2E family transporter [candidate division NC10 bacterium]
MDAKSSHLTELERKALLVGALLLLFYLLSKILFIIKPFVLAFLIGLAFHPAISWLEKKGIKRLVSLILGVLLFLILLGLAGYFFLPPFLTEMKDLLSQFPRLWALLGKWWNALHNLSPRLVPPFQEEEMGQVIFKNMGRYFPAVRQFASGLLTFLATSVLVFFILLFGLLDPRHLKDRLLEAVPPGHRKKASHIGGRILNQLKNWVQGLLLAMLFVGLLSYLGLLIVGVKNALAFAILSGLLEIVPYFGPILSALLPAALTALDDPWKAAYVILVFFIVQQVENNLLIPVLMSRQLTLHPLGIIFFFLVMTYYFGLFGTFVAVPTYACVAILYEELYLPWIDPAARGGEKGCQQG